MNLDLNRLCLLALFFLGTCSITKAQDATAIITKMDQLRRGNSSYSELSISIIRPKWTRKMDVRSWALSNDFSMILITAPARDKGTVYLKRKKEIWNWVPRIERSIKLPPSMMMQSWMGSDFTNDDLIEESSIVEDYTHNLLEESTLNDREVFVVELIPKENAPVVWGKILVWVDKTDYIELKTEMYDEDGFLVSTIHFSDIKTFDNKKLPARMEYIPEENEGYKTVIEYQLLEFEIDINENFFTERNMTRIK